MSTTLQLQQRTAFEFRGTAFLFIFILWVKAIYPASSGIADTDFYWHIAYGQWMLEHKVIPPVDTFSWTFAGEPYRLTQWFGELIMGLAYNLGGLTGTKAISVILAGITLWFAWRAAARYVSSSMALGIAAVCNLIQIVTPMRPQLFSFALLSLMMYLLVMWALEKRRWILFAVPAVMALWVNLHGGFVIGLLLMGIFIAGHVYEEIQKPIEKRVWRTIGWLCCSFVVAGMATLVNPYGIGAWQSVAYVSTLQSSTVISEWMPVNLTTEVGWFYLLNLVPFVALLAAQAWPRVTFGAIAGVFLVFGILANRQVALLAAVMSPILASMLVRTPQYAALTAQLTNGSRPLIYGALAAVLTLSLPTIQSYGDKRWEETINGQYPVAATDFLVENGLTTRVFSDTLEASYLIFRKIPVFIDGRMDLYGDLFFFEYYLATQGAPGWNKLLDKQKPDILLLRKDTALRQLVVATGKWKPVFEDDRYSVLSSNPGATSVESHDPSYLDDRGRMLREYLP